MAITAGYGNAKFVDDAQVCDLFFIFFFVSTTKRERERDREPNFDRFFSRGSLSLSLSLSNYQISETSLRRARAFFSRAPLA